MIRFLVLGATTLPGESFSNQVKENTLSIDATGALQLCNKNFECKGIVLTGGLAKAIADGYENLSIVTLFGDKNERVAATSAGRCSKFFSFDESSRNFSTLIFLGSKKEICNYKIVKSYLISAYKIDSKQYEDVYERKNRSYQLILSDGCVGCDQVARTVYIAGRLSQKLLVSNQPNFAQRRPIFSSVIANRALLYAKPTNSSKTAMYLVHGDCVQLLEYYDEDGLWYFVKYSSKNNSVFTKWVKCQDLAICK